MQAKAWVDDGRSSRPGMAGWGFAVLMAAAARRQKEWTVSGLTEPDWQTQAGTEVREHRAGRLQVREAEVLEKSESSAADDFAAGGPMHIIRRVQTRGDRAPRASTSSDSPTTWSFPSSCTIWTHRSRTWHSPAFPPPFMASSLVSPRKSVIILDHRPGSADCNQLGGHDSQVQSTSHNQKCLSYVFSFFFITPHPNMPWYSL